MSDFIFSKKSITRGKLTKEIQSIYHQDRPIVKEMHGDWGSLAVSYNLYNGFQPFETIDHICIVIGGPVLGFQDNEFLVNDSGVTGTQAIYERWVNNIIQWDEDLSGPFVILLINKVTWNVTCVTDLMSFIPVFTYVDSSNLILSTHVDMLARLSDQQDEIDLVSKADFILHSVVTFPYTSYTHLRQIEPATVHTIQRGSNQLQSKAYWTPEEKIVYESIDQASDDLRDGLQNYVNKITKSMSHVAQFISGGEDSRLLSALLPYECTRDAFIFLDHMNIEGKLAKRAAETYGASFNLATRSKTHYLEILPACSDLVGSDSQYANVHTFVFHKRCKLNEYSAVFGGLFSDALFKGSRIKKVGGQGLFPFLPHIKDRNYSPGIKLENSAFTDEVLLELTKRRQAHLQYVSSFRSESAEEWFELWPTSMNSSIPNLHGNRRLFRSYEPFMAKEVVKLSAIVPQSWKLNRKLFHNTVKPLLEPTKWLMNSDGRYPYFPWYINSLPQFIVWFYQQVGRRTGLIKRNQGSWAEWNVVMKSSAWQQAISEYSDGLKGLKNVFVDKDVGKLFSEGNLNKKQRMNLLQVLYYLHNKTI
ncbi:asparagine synthase-related protein [Virgibacillus necropolis]|uniref:asparagine synthase (glutamine-hydrolyzing) n=1 Tax=Virgibacillus necropolis TaxID=163877 RepID=A0A221M9D1_9BACI|nr:asparagine synthase-related protein [Virgibacillus necropolis]ASN04231.1 hypothetical protein CFK40_04015 [Virgibacillus necropolis]